MNDPIVWIIIIVFYAPLHFMLPVLFLFIVGHESETDRRQMIRRALLDSAVSMVVAFGIAIALVKHEQVGLAMVTLILFMLVPFMRILRNRRVLK
jgi:uncharacterized membrane protein YesL